MLRLTTIALLASAAAGCVPRSEPAPPQPEPQPKATPVSRPLPVPPPPTSWQDVPLTQGGWYYRSQPGGSQALFGPANSEASFIVRCDMARRQVTLARGGGSSGPLTIRTTFGARSFPATAQSEPLPYLSAPVAASDRFLDSMVFSRGRFTVETPGQPMLVVPAWAEPARVVEDCRG